MSKRNHFDDIVRKHQSRVHFYFRKLGFSKEESEDLSQEVLFRVYQGMKGFRREASLRTWILTIASNVYKNEVRSRNTEKRKHISISVDQPVQEDGRPLSDLLADESPLSNLPDGELLKTEQLKVLDEAIQTLPAKQKQCLLMYGVQGLKYSEIADALDLSIGSVKSNISAARNGLREKLGKNFQPFDMID